VHRVEVNERLRPTIGPLRGVRTTETHQPADPVAVSTSDRCIKSKIGTRTRLCEVQ
jgi:hypothetical protein